MLQVGCKQVNLHQIPAYLYCAVLAFVVSSPGESGNYHCRVAPARWGSEHCQELHLNLCICFILGPWCVIGGYFVLIPFHFDFFFLFNASPFLEKVISFLKKMTFNWYFCLAFEIGLKSIF